MKLTVVDRGEVRSGGNAPYARSLPISVALHRDSLVAWNLNDQPLSREHGFPVRLVVPGWYGMASVKWLAEISVLNQPFQGIFQTEEYIYLEEEGVPDHNPVSQMRVRSLIVNPSNSSVLNLGTIEISGIAWTGIGRVTKVEISLDGGENWLETLVEPPNSSYGIFRWQYTWRPKSTGSYQMTARAYDSEGHVQPLTSRWNKGGNGNNKIHHTSVKVGD
jgi:DMSO/TMAO reductase YedYZ molybdopterin-dependent catalytic subunit